MKIIGYIKNSDYVNCMKFTKYGNYPLMTVYSFIFGIMLAVTLFCMYGKENLFINCILLLIFILLFSMIRMHIWVMGFNKLAECNNLGNCMYEIADLELKFIGSQYSCQIPIKSIKEILNSNGTYYLKFGNYSGFILPCQITDGSISEFINKLKEKVKSAQQGDAVDLMTNAIFTPVTP